MPEWASAGEYSYTVGLSRCGWAWEFLRRNADYARDWDGVGRPGPVPDGMDGPVLITPGIGQAMAKWGLIFRG